MVADRLWLVEHGHVSDFDGDMTDYKKWLLAKRGGASTVNADKPTTKPVDKQLSTGRQRRQNTSAVRAKIRSCETELETLGAQKQAIETKMSAPGFMTRPCAQYCRAWCRTCPHRRTTQCG